MRRVMCLGLLLTGCGAGDGTSDGGPLVTAVDSAGVAILTHAVDPADLPPIRLAEPLFAHGTRDGDYLFQNVIDGAILADGTVVVADIGSTEVVRIAADGSSHTVLAGRGQGPSEVRSPISVIPFAGDSLVVEDDGNAKFLYLHGDEVSRVVSVAGASQAAYALRAFAVDEDGRLLMTTSSYRSDAGTGWIQGWMVAYDPVTRAADSVAGFDMAISVPRDGKRNAFAPFGNAAASGLGFVYGRSDRAELEWRDAAGALRQVVRWTPRRRHPDASDLALVAERMREDLARVNPRMPADRLSDFLDEQVARLDLVPDEPMPLYGELRDYGEAGVWLPDYDIARGAFAGTVGYVVVAADGRAIERVELATPARILDVSHGRVLATVRDELGVDRVAVFAWPPRPTAGSD